MKKVLFCLDEERPDASVFYPVDIAVLRKNWDKIGFANSGNLLFISSLNQFLCREKITYRNNKTVEQVREGGYDLALHCSANLFNECYYDEMLCLAEEIKAFRMPVYVISVGIQIRNDESIRSLADKINYPVKAYVDSIYESGGELALRGYYTKELLDIIVPDNTAKVVGCPSLYAAGPDLTITNEKVSKEEFLFSLNGYIKDMRTDFVKFNFDKYPHMYVDQGELGNMIYGGELENITTIKTLKLIKRYSLDVIQELINNNVKLFYDMPVWKEYLGRYSFSFGKRIHGNIAAILSGVPALLNSIDKRTEEIADFYCVPKVKIDYKDKSDIYDLYLKTDYSRFNREFKEKYYAFEKFLLDTGIVDEIGTSEDMNKYIKNKEWKYPEQPDFIEIEQKIKPCKCLLNVLRFLQ